MKKKLTYRDKLLELAKIYNVKEVLEYIKRRKNLTSGQLELILRKNKIAVPKDYQSNFFRENIKKPISKYLKQIEISKDNKVRSLNKLSRRAGYLKNDSRQSIANFFNNLRKSIASLRKNSFNSIINFFSNFWKTSGAIGLAFLNILPLLWTTIYNFVGNVLTDLFNGIYNQKINASRANQAIIGFFVIVGIVTIIISGVTTFNNPKKLNENEIVKKIEPPKKKELNKQKKNSTPKIQVKKEAKKPNITKPKVEKKKKEKIVKAILPDLNLKTETVLNLFKDVDYDLNTVRYEKIVQPIYFTQFPRDLDEIQSVKLKKETFIKIVLPLVVAENEKILEDRFKLKKITNRKITTDIEKQWLRQKFLEYKVKKGNVDELMSKMDIIPASIALAQAAKESGWGTSRFALEGNAIFGQWTWNGKGIAPLNRDKSKKHKILKFPILRASVKAYKNNLNTHKSYLKFREMRKNLREKNKKITGLILTKTLDNYAETGSEYTKILEQIITQNRLMDFELVRLTNSGKKLELDL
jgi:Bax protein